MQLARQAGKSWEGCPRPKPEVRRRSVRLVPANIAALIGNGGQITLGALDPIKCVAIATDEASCLAMPQRRSGETLQQLLERLDAAIDRAWTADQFTDEINPPLPPRKKR